MSEKLQKVAYIGLRNKDGSWLMNVPLYIKVSEVTKNGLTETQEELVRKISQIMINRYDQQIKEEIEIKRKEKKSNEDL